MDEDQKLLEEICMNIEFMRLSSTSKEAKVGEFWKYLDNQNVLKPYEAPKFEEDKTCVFGGMESFSCPTSSTKSKITSPCKSKSLTKKESKLKKEPKKEEKDENTMKIEKYFKEDLRFADTVETTYDEINADLAYFHKQLKKCRCKPKACKCKKKDDEVSDDEV